MFNLGPWVLYLFLANGSVTVVPGIETLEQCLRHGHTAIVVDPSRFTLKEPMCLPLVDPDRHPPVTKQEGFFQ
jgi:hypothetical protein